MGAPQGEFLKDRAAVEQELEELSEETPRRRPSRPPNVPIAESPASGW